MPRTFLVRRTALQFENPSSTESEEDSEINSTELHVNHNNKDLSVHESSPAIPLVEPRVKEEEIEFVSEALNLPEVVPSDKSPTYLSRAISKVITVDSVTGAIENKTSSKSFIKEEIPDPELDAEVAYHTDRSFSSSTRDISTCSRPISISSVESTGSQVHHSNTYSDISESSLQEHIQERIATLSLPLITPHQPLPPFASLAYNVFVSSRKTMGETLQETVTMDTQPTTVMKLPLRFPLNNDQDQCSFKNERLADDGQNCENKQIKETRVKSNDEISEKKFESSEQKQFKVNPKETIKSAPKIWNPFHHVSTPKTNKVLPVSPAFNSPVSQIVNNLRSPHLPQPVINYATPLIANSYHHSERLDSPQMRIPEVRIPDAERCYNFSYSTRSPFLRKPGSSFQTVPQINASQNVNSVFSPRIPSPFLPYRSHCTPESYASSTMPPSRTSTPTITPIPTTPIHRITPISTTPIRSIPEVHMSNAQKRSCTPVSETPKRLRIDNVPFQIYKESPTQSFDQCFQNLPYRCPITPVITNNASQNQENTSVNRTPVTHLQQRAALQHGSPILAPSSISKENIPNQSSKDVVLKVVKTQQTPQKFEVINGGYGIKNPSFVPPKPADITNIQQDENGKGSFMCKVCGKEFTIQRLLNRHLKCHSEAKRYLCTFCGKGFNDTFDLKRHTRIHTGVKPYKCEHCEKAFTQRCSLESHSRKVHSMELSYGYKQRRNKTYVCEDCGHSTTDPQVHFKHLKDHHPNCPALAKPHDKRHFKFQANGRPSGSPLRLRH
ncbi:OVOL [Mytilus coruscus]|uniref:OVOL n=1 Tax=Mytilus coruscus TaxID=42192 RepID=A0A6J8AQ04_MYTCO|nr:OVOL [Mytilus coruscus]